MQINKLVFGVLVLGCLGAAGVGGYANTELGQVIALA